MTEEITVREDLAYFTTQYIQHADGHITVRNWVTWDGKSQYFGEEETGIKQLPTVRLG